MATGTTDKSGWITTLSFWMVHSLLYVISLLPLWLWHGISRLLFVLVYRIWGYRKKVVKKNLSACFPQKTAEEILELERTFYQHFCDVLVESIKAYSMSDRVLAKRVKIVPTNLIQEFESLGRGGFLIASHYGNFEWMIARIDLMINRRFQTFGIYNILKNPVADRIVKGQRQKRGSIMYPMRFAMRAALRELQSVCFFGMIGDQSPHRGQRLYFAPLFGRPTAVHSSMAKVILRAKCPAYFARFNRLKRGYYELEFVKIPVEDFLPENEENIDRLTDYHVNLLEQNILENPAYWLWTHRRWKHSPREGDRMSKHLL